MFKPKFQNFIIVKKKTETKNVQYYKFSRFSLDKSLTLCEITNTP